MALKLSKSKMARTLVKGHKLVPHLDRILSQGDFEWEYTYKPKREDDAWHPSSHCTPSAAELYHHAVEPEVEKPSATMQKTFQVGHFWHGYLQHVLVAHDLAKPHNIERRGWRAWAYEDDYETPLPFHWVTGSADVAPCTIPVHGDYLVDFKSMGSHMFKPHVPPGDTIEKWECQLNIYMDFCDLEKALIVGILKDSPHDFKEFEFHRNQKLVDALYEKWQLVSECLDEGVEPPADYEVELPLQGPVDQ